MASAGAAGAAFAVWYGLDELLGRSLGAQIVSVGAASWRLPAPTSAWRLLIRVRELQTLLSLRRRSATTSEE